MVRTRARLFDVERGRSGAYGKRFPVVLTLLYSWQQPSAEIASAERLPEITADAFRMNSAAFLLSAPSRQLTTLSSVDILILVLYFVIVLFIGFYVRDSTNTSEEFFLAGREMTAWIAGLSFVSANLGSLELMGWAGSAYQYGILATHWYWIGAIPAMLFLGIVMMPFYYISKTHSVPGYLQLRFGESSRALSAVSFAFMTILMSGVNMYAMAVVMQTVLGWNITFSIWVGAVTVAVYVMLGGLRSAIINEVLQFILIWAGAAMIPILGLIEAGGWSNLKLQIAHNVGSTAYTHMWSTLGTFKGNPMGIQWTGIVFGLGAVISFGYWTTDFLVVQRVLSANNLRAAKMAPIIGAAFKMAVPLIVIVPGLIALGLTGADGHSVYHLVAGDVAKTTGEHAYDTVLPLMLIRSCPPIHRRRHADFDRNRLPCNERSFHHGLCAGAFQLFYRAAVWNCDPGNALEASNRCRWFLGPACGYSLVDWHVSMGAQQSRCAAVHRNEPRRAANG